MLHIVAFLVLKLLLTLSVVNVKMQAQEEFTTARDRATAASVTKTKVHGHDVSRGSDGVSGPPPVVAFAALTSRIDSAANQLMWATPLGRRAAHKSA